VAEGVGGSRNGPDDQRDDGCQRAEARDRLPVLVEEGVVASWSNASVLRGC